MGVGVGSRGRDGWCCGCCALSCEGPLGYSFLFFSSRLAFALNMSCYHCWKKEEEESSLSCRIVAGVVVVVVTALLYSFNPKSSSSRERK